MGLRRIIGGVVGLGVAGAAVVGGAGAMDDNTTRNGSGEIVEAGGLGAWKMRAGDCVNDPGPAVEVIASFDAVPCETPHDMQVYAVYDLPPATYAEAEVGNHAALGCIARWWGVFGVAFGEDPVLIADVLIPNEAAWQDGQRSVSCVILSADGSELTGSRVVSGRVRLGGGVP